MTLCNPVNCSTPGFPIHHHLPELAPSHVHRVHDAIQPSHPLWPPSPSAFLRIRIFFSKLALHIRWPKYWSFSFSISPSIEYSGLISFRMDWFDLLADSQESSPTPQFKSTILWCSAFFMVQISNSYMNIGKTIALTTQTFVGKVMSLFFNKCLGWSQLC